MAISGGPLYNADDRAAPYAYWRSMNVYAWDGGIIQMPLAKDSATAPSVVGRLHAPFTVRMYYWSVGRLGAPPKMPHPDSGDDNEVLSKVFFYPLDPVVDVNMGSWIVRAAGCYHYLLRTPMIPGRTPLRVSSPPYVGASPEVMRLTASDFSRSIQ